MRARVTDRKWAIARRWVMATRQLDDCWPFAEGRAVCPVRHVTPPILDAPGELIAGGVATMEEPACPHRAPACAR
jgi:hypothetical protein